MDHKVPANHMQSSEFESRSECDVPISGFDSGARVIPTSQPTGLLFQMVVHPLTNTKEC